MVARLKTFWSDLFASPSEWAERMVEQDLRAASR
jgi:hypothetical protein